MMGRPREASRAAGAAADAADAARPAGYTADMAGTFDGLDAVVTGGTGALGSAVVARLRAAGSRVHVPCFDAAELERFEHAGDAGVNIVTGIDLRDENAVEKYFADLPGLFALVNVAGGFAMAPIASTTGADFEHMMAMNARTCFLCCREGVKKIRAHARENEARGAKGGRIVNVAARPALEPRTGAGMVAYTTSKAAVAALTIALAEEVASEDILINAVAPSIMDTPANRSAMPNADHAAWPKVDDVAATIEFLASPGNAVTRGGIVPVYGRS